MARSILVAAAAALVAAQPVPLPNTMDGFVKGSASAPVQVEGFLDLLCPDCAGDWPTVNQMLAHYGPDKVSFRLHIFPLPYHTFAFKAAWTAQVLASLNTSNPDGAVFAWADLMYSGVQQQFWNDAVAGNSSNQIEAMYAQQAATLGYSASAVLNGLQDSDFDEDARVQWKYGASRYTTGTPHYLINGLPVDDQLGNGQLSDWEALIDPLLPSADGKTKAKAKGMLGLTQRKKRSHC